MYSRSGPHMNGGYSAEAEPATRGEATRTTTDAEHSPKRADVSRASHSTIRDHSQPESGRSAAVAQFAVRAHSLSLSFYLSEATADTPCTRLAEKLRMRGLLGAFWAAQPPCSSRVLFGIVPRRHAAVGCAQLPRAPLQNTNDVTVTITFFPSVSN